MKKRNKLVSALLCTTLVAGLLVGCSSKPAQEAPPADAQKPAQLEPLVVGASSTPHAEILAVTKDLLAAKGYELKITEFADYVQPNMALDSGDLDANYFQHLPYLEDFNKENKTALVSAAAIHYEPLGLYPGKTAKVEDLADGAMISLPNDSTNEARALLLLEAQGLIKVNPEAGFKATVNDITENPKKLVFKELDAASLARTLQDVDMSVINGNYAIQAGLNAATDAIAKEEKDSASTETFANILAVRSGEEASEKTKALVEALQSPEVKTFIENQYKGAVVPMF